MKKTIQSVVLLVALALTCAHGLKTARAAGSLVGGLYVKTNPAGARIYIDGKLMGVSPCGITDVGIGEVEIKAQKSGYGESSKRVEVETDRIRTVEITLQPIENRGSIVVLVEPSGSDVSIDRVPFDTTPCRIENIRAGTRRVEISRDGYVPMVKKVSVIAGQEQVVKGELQEGEDWIGPSTSLFGEEEEDVAEEDEIDEGDVPLPEDMPEAAAFQPVRKLLRERNYEGALSALNRMASDEAMKDYRGRISRDRRFIRRAKEVVSAGYRALHGKVGEVYPIPLSGGINLKGEVQNVTEEQIVLAMDGRTKTIDLDRVDIDRIIKLAASEFSPDKPANRALFGIIYAMEGQFQEAAEAINRAARTGYNVTEERSFLESERTWEAAQEKLERQKEEERRKEEMEKKREELRAEAEASTISILVDRVHGDRLDQAVVSELQGKGIEVNSAYEALEEENLSESAVLVIKQGYDGETLDKETAQRIARFVNKGGGLVYFGYRSMDESLLGPLQQYFKVGLQPGGLRVSPRAPERHPRDVVPAGSARRHPVTTGATPVVFSIRSPMVQTARKNVLLVSSRYVSHISTGQRPVPLLAAVTRGKGKVVVFASMPDLRHEETGEGAVRLVLNAIAWASR